MDEILYFILGLLLAKFILGIFEKASIKVFLQNLTDKRKKELWDDFQLKMDSKIETDSYDELVTKRRFLVNEVKKIDKKIKIIFSTLKD